MAHKSFYISLALVLALAAAAYAGGQKEPSASTATAPGTTGQKLVLTGSVSFQDLHPTLKSGDKVYELMVPRYLV